MTRPYAEDFGTFPLRTQGRELQVIGEPDTGAVRILFLIAGMARASIEIPPQACEQVRRACEAKVTPRGSTFGSWTTSRGWSVVLDAYEGKDGQTLAFKPTPPDGETFSKTLVAGGALEALRRAIAWQEAWLHGQWRTEETG